MVASAQCRSSSGRAAPRLAVAATQRAAASKTTSRPGPRRCALATPGGPSAGRPRRGHRRRASHPGEDAQMAAQRVPQRRERQVAVERGRVAGEREGVPAGSHMPTPWRASKLCRCPLAHEGQDPALGRQRLEPGDLLRSRSDELGAVRGKGEEMLIRSHAAPITTSLARLPQGVKYDARRSLHHPPSPRSTTTSDTYGHLMPGLVREHQRPHRRPVRSRVTRRVSRRWGPCGCQRNDWRLGRSPAPSSSARTPAVCGAFWRRLLGRDSNPQPSG